jgi:hypothetical protein
MYKLTTHLLIYLFKYFIIIRANFHHRPFFTFLRFLGQTKSLRPHG